MEGLPKHYGFHSNITTNFSYALMFCRWANSLVRTAVEMWAIYFLVEENLISYPSAILIMTSFYISGMLAARQNWTCLSVAQIFRSYVFISVGIILLYCADVDILAAIALSLFGYYTCGIEAWLKNFKTDHVYGEIAEEAFSVISVSTASPIFVLFAQMLGYPFAFLFLLVLNFISLFLATRFLIITKS